MGRSTSLLLALASGLVIAVQARVTGALKEVTGESALSAAVTFTSGLVLMTIICLVTRTNRQAVKRAVTGAFEGRFPPIFLFTGLLGAIMVFGQGATVDIIGVALFSMIFIGGQMIASTVLDTAGWVPAGKTKLGATRVVGIILALAGVAVAMSLKMTDTALDPAVLLVPFLVVFVGGLLQPAQMAANGVVAAHVGRPEPIVFFNYLTGTTALAIASIPAISTGALSKLPLGPGDWWYYTGGVLGSVMVMGGAVLVRTIGSLLYTLGMVGGQVLGSLVVDSLFPTPGAIVGWQTVVGGVLTVLALGVASMNPRRGRRPEPPPAVGPAG